MFFRMHLQIPKSNYEEFENFSSNLNLFLLNISDNHPLAQFLQAILIQRFHNDAIVIKEKGRV